MTPDQGPSGKERPARLRLPEKPARRLFDWLRGSPTGLIVSALAVGTGAGLGAIAFRYLIYWFTVLFTGNQDYSAADHAVHPYLPQLGMWFVILAPAVGGLLYGPLTERFAQEARGHGVPEVMLAVAERGGRIRSVVRVGEHLVKGTCHVCHPATGPGASHMMMYMRGVIPSLASMPQQMSPAAVLGKVRAGAYGGMGMMASMSRMPVFRYLTDEEVVAAYLYLARYPPLAE